MGTVINKPENVMLNERLTFSVSTDLPNPYKYHWRQNGILIPGAPSASTFVYMPTKKEDLQNKFSCTVFCVTGQETSEDVSLEEEES